MNNVFIQLYKNVYAKGFPDKTFAPLRPGEPSEPVIKYAYAMAVAERGEDAGLSAQEATALADQSLADHTSIENGRYRDEYVWHSV